MKTPFSFLRPAGPRNGSLHRVNQRGYTVVELLMGLVVFSIGVTGIAAMQKVTSSSNSHAKNLAIASHIAQSWQEYLAIDAGRWTNESVAHQLINTEWLKNVETNNEVWHLPATSTLLKMGPGFDALGSFLDLSEATASQQLVFCTHIRLTRVMGRTSLSTNQLIRTEVRVFWPREGRHWNEGNPYCTADTVTSVGQASESFHFVYQTSAVRQGRGPGG